MAEPQNPALRIEQVPLDHLRAIAESGELYAVADATDAPAVPRKVLELGPARAVSLYRGTAEEEFWDVAPYLMRVDPVVLDWIVSTLDKERWGIFAISKANLDTLRTHFRHFLKVVRPTTGAGMATHDLLFKIRPGHIEAFEPLIEQNFFARVSDHLRKYHAPAVENLSDDSLLRCVAIGVTRGRKYGLTSESALAGFVGLMFEFAPNFDEHFPFQQVLRDSRIPQDKRLDVLVDNSSEGDWDEVERRSDLNAWVKA